MSELTAAWQSASEEMYKAQGNPQQNPFENFQGGDPFQGGNPFNGNAPNNGENPAGKPNSNEPTDVEYEEVK